MRTGFHRTVADRDRACRVGARFRTGIAEKERDIAFVRKSIGVLCGTATQSFRAHRRGVQATCGRFRRATVPGRTRIRANYPVTTSVPDINPNDANGTQWAHAMKRSRPMIRASGSWVAQRSPMMEDAGESWE